MSHVIFQLANIPLRDSVLDQLELGKVFENFAKNYKKLDDLKNFRSEYEQRNFFSRWWGNDELRDAQLNSAEVQAEFSKTLGQLVAISVIQAKELNEQQRRLGDQQRIIQEQVIAVREHSKEIEQQQHIQDEQAKKLKQLVADYISVKGISDDSIRRLAKIVAEIDRTKEEFFAESRRVDEHLSSDLESLGKWAQSALDKLDDKLNVGSAAFQNALQSLGDSQTKNHLSLVDDIKISFQKQSQLEAKLKELEDFSRRELVLLDEKTTSKLQTVDGLIQALEARATAAEQQARENAERTKKLESERAAIIKGFISLQKEIATLRVEATQENQRAKFVLLFASVSFLAALGALGMQLLRV